MSRKKPSKKTTPKVYKTSALTKSDRSSDYIKLPGKARQFRKAGGRKVISRRQFDQLRKREGKKPANPILSAFASSSGTKEFWKYVRNYKETQNLKSESIKKIASSKDFRQTLKAFRTHGGDGNRKPGGKWATAIEALNPARKPGSQYNVGETPKVA